MSYQLPQIKTGDLRTPVFFYSQNSLGPEPGTSKGTQLFWCLAEVYGSSSKDLVILDAHGKSEGVTINIPDPHEEFQPSNEMLVEIQDFRYKVGDEFKQWDVVDVIPDLKDNRFVKVVLGRDSA
jgi:hypothetical protein